MAARLRIALSLITAFAVVHAQDAPQRPIFRTEANYVRVDLYPTLNGVPITDLRQDEVEVLDNGVVQKIEQFERVQIRTAGPQETRVEPNTVRESRAMLEDARARVFVLFLDTYHVEVAGSHNIRAPLVRLLDQAIGQDDLVGVMTPAMSASDVTFARKTTTIDGFLTRYWYWGDRDKVNPSDREKNDYKMCYPGLGPTPDCSDDDRGVADEMIDRMREKRTLDALEDLVVFLRGVREERKAVIAITDGWVLYGPNPALGRRLKCQVPTGPTVGVDPRSGKLTTSVPEGYVGLDQCERDRMQLANIDDRTDFRRILQEANRANTSFYPVDPRGLVAFDQGLERPPLPLAVNSAVVTARANALRTLADETDGIAVVSTNKIEPAMQRIAADLTSYYLLGYYTTAPLDCKFHSITVRVKRPGVQVRARRGYLAPSAAEVTRTSAAPPPVSPAEAAAAAEARAIEAVVAPLGGYARDDVPLRLQTVSTATRIWIAGELSTVELRGAWRSGGTVDLLLTTANGETVGSAHATVPAGGRSFEATVPLPAPGEYDVRVRARAAGEAPPINMALKLAASSPAGAAGARFMRRGPATANRDTPAADLRFRRGDTVRVEWPTTATESATAVSRLLDRTGKPLAVPVTAGEREADGGRWRTAELSLTPLGPGDYIVELDCGAERLMAAFRVVP